MSDKESNLDNLQNLLSIDISDISFKDAEKIIDDLKREINSHNYYYYIKDAPIISDADYDKLMRNLQMLEERFPELITRIHQHRE